MELIRGIHNITPKHRGCVMTIGNFDGIHVGHHHLLQQVQSQARRLNLPSTVMTFEPQPMEFFVKEKAPARLTRLRDKFFQLKKLGIDRLLCINFNRQFSQQSADEFIEHLLVKLLDVKFLVVGDDFCFGQDRKGDFDRLKKAGDQYGFTVVNTKSFCLQEQRVSSTQIRYALSEDRLADVKSMLGRYYSITGRVSHGRKLGRTIGFPTANIPLKRCVSPVSGVYIVQSIDDKGERLSGVANIGHRPTVNGTRQQLEVHFFDYKANLYGQQLEIELLFKIRDEQKFESVEQLKQQIELDCQSARVWLSENRDYVIPV